MSLWTQKVESHLIEEFDMVNKQEAMRESVKRLAEHRKIYRCHVCSKPSAGPQATYFKKGGRIKVRVIWRIPTGLEQCVLCGKYVCKDHFYKGACQHCGENL